MTTMLTVENLIKLGFNRNEAKVYLSLIKFGKTSANQLIKDTRFHKNIVYDNLDKLINKGLVTYIIEENKRVYVASSPDMLIDFIDEDMKELDQKKEIAVKLAGEIEKRIKIISYKQEASIYRGQKGIRVYHNEIIKKGNNYLVFGAPKQSVDIMGDYFWENFQAKRMEKKIKVDMIFNLSLKYFGNKLLNKYTRIRYFDRYFEPLTQTDIHEDKVAIIVWSDVPVLFLIEDKEVAKSYKKYFYDMWKKAKGL